MIYEAQHVFKRAQRLAGLILVLEMVEDEATRRQIRTKCGIADEAGAAELDALMVNASNRVNAEATPSEVGAILASEITRARNELRLALHALETKTCTSN